MKNNQHKVEEILNDFRDRFQQVEDDIGYYGWEPETEFMNVEKWLIATLTQVIKQTKKETLEEIENIIAEEIIHWNSGGEYYKNVSTALNNIVNKLANIKISAK